MVRIISEQGYPKDEQVIVRVDYYIKVSPCEGGILIVGKDSQGREYKPKNEPQNRGFYVLPSGTCYSVAVGSDPEKNHPAIYFPFELQRHGEPKSTDPHDEFIKKFGLTLRDEAMQRIILDTEVEQIFKEIACWGAFELSEDTRVGKVSSHFWGEMYRERTPVLEKFLEAYSGK